MSAPVGDAVLREIAVRLPRGLPQVMKWQPRRRTKILRSKRLRRKKITFGKPGP
jgi:hypothetical protein